MAASAITKEPEFTAFWLSLAAVSGVETALPRPAIGQALEEFQPDIIHVVNPAVLGLAGLFIQKC